MPDISSAILQPHAGQTTRYSVCFFSGMVHYVLVLRSRFGREMWRLSQGGYVLFFFASTFCFAYVRDCDPLLYLFACMHSFWPLFSTRTGTAVNRKKTGTTYHIHRAAEFGKSLCPPQSRKNGHGPVRASLSIFSVGC